MPVTVVTPDDLTLIYTQIDALTASVADLGARVVALEAYHEQPPTDPAVQITTDPQVYPAGYMPATAVQVDGRWLFMPIMGHNHVPDSNNSVRGYDPVTDAWTVWQGDLSTQITRDQWYAGQDTTPPSASGRNNSLVFYLPWSQEVAVVSPGASLAGNHGVWSLTEKRWTHLVPNGQQADFIPGISYPSESEKGWTIPWNAAHAVCEDLQALLMYGGTDTDTLYVFRWQPDGGYLAERHNSQPFGAVNSLRQGGCCRGQHFYLFGGAASYNTPALARAWRVDLQTLAWEQLPDMPAPTGGYTIAVYDQDHDKIVVVDNAGGPQAYVYDPVANSWTDATGDLGLPNPLRAMGAYVPGHGLFLRGGYFNGRGWAASAQVWTARLSAPVVSEPPVDPPTNTLVVTEYAGAVGTPTGGGSKHGSYCYAPELDRVYAFGGDYSTGGSYHREVFARAQGALWQQESGYCPADKADPWPRGRCEAGWSWDAGRGRFWMFAGVYEENHSSQCGYPASELMYAYVMCFDPAAKVWSIPTQSAPLGGSIKKHGIFDAQADRLLTVMPGSTSVIYAFDIPAGQWSEFATYPGYLWQRGQMTTAGRKWYFTDEANIALIEMDLDTAQFTSLGPLPEDPHADDGVGLFAPQGLLAAWGGQIAYTYHYKRNTIWLYELVTGAWSKHVLAPTGRDVYGNDLYTVGDALVVGGGNGVAWNEPGYFFEIRRP